jgi:hypothetical protein
MVAAVEQVLKWMFPEQTLWSCGKNKYASFVKVVV